MEIGIANVIKVFFVVFYWGGGAGEWMYVKNLYYVIKGTKRKTKKKSVIMFVTQERFPG